EQPGTTGAAVAVAKKDDKQLIPNATDCVTSSDEDPQPSSKKAKTDASEKSPSAAQLVTAESQNGSIAGAGDANAEKQAQGEVS
ncbi:unnamed protein product, partial [Amoebophrya sp. A25]